MRLNYVSLSVMMVNPHSGQQIWLILRVSMSIYKLQNRFKQCCIPNWNNNKWNLQNLSLETCPRQGEEGGGGWIHNMASLFEREPLGLLWATKGYKGPRSQINSHIQPKCSRLYPSFMQQRSFQIVHNHKKKQTTYIRHGTCVEHSKEQIGEKL